MGSLDDDTISIRALTGSAAIQLNKYCTSAKGKPSKALADVVFVCTGVKTKAGRGLECLRLTGGVEKSPGPHS